MLASGGAGMYGSSSADQFLTQLDQCASSKSKSMLMASRRVTLGNVQQVGGERSTRRQSGFDRAVRRAYGATPKFGQWRLAGRICDTIYWAVRSLQFMLCYKHVELEDDDPDILAEFPIRPPSLHDLTIRTNFDPRWIKSMYGKFKQQCPNGRMFEDEFCQIFRKFFPKSCSDAYAARVFHALDVADAGEITFEQLLMRLAEYNEHSDKQQIDFAHRLLIQEQETTAQFIYFDSFVEYVKAIFELSGKESGTSTTEYVCPFSDEQIEHRARLAFEKLDRYNRGRVSKSDLEFVFNKNPAMLESLKEASFMQTFPTLPEQTDPETPSTPETIHL